MAVLLSDAKARNIKPGDKSLPHGGVVGLTLHPSDEEKGSGKWVFRFTSPITRTRRNAGLGVYPDVKVAEAAKRAQAMRELIAQGKDPLEEKEEALRVKQSMPTFEAAARQVHVDKSPGWKTSKHGQEWLSTLVSIIV